MIIGGFAGAKGRVGLLVLACAMALLMVWLGSWQLTRAAQKRQLLDQMHQRGQVELSLQDLLVKEDRYGYQLSMEGGFAPGVTLFLDNQVYQGRPGYQVLRPMVTAQGLLLVDLGWLPQGQDRQVIPAVSQPAGEYRVRGRVARPYHPPLHLGNAEEEWPHRLQTIDTPWLAKQWHQPVLPFVLVLEEGGAWPELIHRQPEMPMAPSRHIGYAVQWFVMALTLIGLTAWWWRKTTHEVETEHAHREKEAK